MPVRKLPSGRWQVRVWDADRDTHVGIGTYATDKEARKAEARHDAGIQEPTVEQAVRPHGREKFGPYALDILQARKHTLKPGTWHAYAWSLSTHLATFHKMALPDITESVVIKWWRSMEGQAHARKAAYAVLSMVMKRAVRQGKIVKTPCTIEGASRDVSKKRPTFHAADVRMMIELASDEQMKVSLWVLLGTGIRVGELLALDWQDVSLEEGTIDVHRHLTRHGMEDGTKAHADGRRVLAMPSAATDALQSVWESRKPLPSDPVFLNARGARLSYHKWNARFVPLRNACGLDDLHAHDLRHIHLSEYAKRSTLKETMNRAGHTDYRSALRYQHEDAVRQKEIVAQLEL